MGSRIGEDGQSAGEVNRRLILMTDFFRSYRHFYDNKDQNNLSHPFFSSNNGWFWKLDIDQRQAKEDRCLQIVDFEMVTKKATDYKRKPVNGLECNKSYKLSWGKNHHRFAMWCQEKTHIHNCFEELQTHVLDMLFCALKRLFGTESDSLNSFTICTFIRKQCLETTFSADFF